MLPGTTPKNRPLVFGKKGAERLHIIYIVRTFSMENFTSVHSYVVNAHTIVNSVYFRCIILLPSHQGYNVYLQQILSILLGMNASHFEFLLRCMIIIKKATLSDIIMLFHSAAINLSLKHGFWQKRKLFSIFH